MVSHKGSQHDSEVTTGQTPRYAVFTSTKLLLCGYPGDITASLTRIIEEEGGKVLTRFYPKSPPQIIVCDKMADSICKEAVKTLQHTVPVVTKQWVEECMRCKAQVEISPYKLKPLAGLQISATNFTAKERAVLQRMVEAAGGTYSAEMHKGICTHLICKTATGHKYTAARQWRSVHIVSDAWVKASEDLGYPAPEEQYLVRPAAEQAGANSNQTSSVACPPPAPHAVPESAMYGSGSTRQPPTGAGCQQQQEVEQQQQQQQQPDPHRPTELQQGNSRPQHAAAASAAAAVANQQPRVRTRRSSQRLAQTAADVQQDAGGGGESAAGEDAATGPTSAAAAAEAALAAAAPPAAQGPSNSTSLRLAALGITDVNACPMFLERVVLWWCGIPAGSGEHLELQTILHAYAGVRFPELCDSVTHIMIGNNASVDELKAVQQYLQSCKRRIEVVSPAWLQLCQQEQRLAPADSRCRLQLNSLMRHAAAITGFSTTAAAGGSAGAGSAAGGAAAGGVAGAGGGGGGGVFANTASRGSFPSEADKPEAAWVPEYWKDQPVDQLQLFKDCYFTLAAVQSYQSDHEKALNHIRRLGGKVFTASSTKPPPGWHKVFAVCPVNMPREIESSLVSSDASFRLVHPSCRVTLYWMEICIKRSELMRVSPRNPLMAPLRYPLPLKDFASVKVAVTGYSPDQRDIIERMVRVLGGSFIKTLGRGVTHLMLPRWGPDPPSTDTTGAGEGDVEGGTAAGGGGSGGGDGGSGSSPQLAETTLKKIAYAQRHKMEMVVSEWLLECASEGRRVQEGLYKPAGDVQLLQLPLGATQAAGATQLPNTQLLMQTQSQAVAPVSRQGSTTSAAPRPPAALKPSQPQQPTGTGVAGLTAPGTSTAADLVPGGGSDAAVPSRGSWLKANSTNTGNSQLNHTQQQQKQRQQQPQPLSNLLAGLQLPKPAQSYAPTAQLGQHKQEQQQQQLQPVDVPNHQGASNVQQAAAGGGLEKPQENSKQHQQPRRQQPARSAASSPLKPSMQVTTTPGRAGSRKRSVAASAAAAADEAANSSSPGQDTRTAAEGQQQAKRPRRQRQQQHNQAAQGSCHDAAEAATAANQPAVGSPLADVCNTMQLNSSDAATAAAAAQITATSGQARASGGQQAPTAAVVTGAITVGSEPQQHQTAAAAAAAVAVAGLIGTEDDAALEGVLSVLNTISSKDGSIPASQQLAGDMLPEHLLSAGRMGSAGAAGGSGVAAGGPGAGSGGGSGGLCAGIQAGGHGLRSKRGRGAAAAGNRSSSEPEDACSHGSRGASAAAAGSGGANADGSNLSGKRPRRASAAASSAGGAGAGGSKPAAGAMLPPAHKPSGSGGSAAAAAAAGSRAGGSRYGTRRSMSATPTDVAMEPSQQVGYDVGDHPEALLAASSAAAGRNHRRGAADEAAKGAMLERLKGLRARSGS